MPLTFKEIAAADVPTPDAGKQTAFLDTADDTWKTKDELGTVAPWGSEGPEGPPGAGVPPTVVAHGSMGASETFDYDDGPAHSGTLNADPTFTFTGATAGECIMTLYLTEDGTGGHINDVTWPGSVVWPGGTPPTFDASAAAVTIIPFVTIDSGTTWYALVDTTGGSDLDAIIAASSGQDIADALAGAAAPDSGNVFATMADVGGGSNPLLAVTRYAPTSQTVYSSTGTSMQDVDATNMAVTFTAPASGNVLIRLNAFGDLNGGAGDHFWGLRESSTDLTGIARIQRAAVGESYISVAIYLTGVTAGSHTYKWSFGASSGTARIIIQDGSAISEWAPGVMEVWAAP